LYYLLLKFALRGGGRSRKGKGVLPLNRAIIGAIHIVCIRIFTKGSVNTGSVEQLKHTVLWLAVYDPETI
jgi:hypothetical protein